MVSASGITAPVFVALGSNIGDRLAQIDGAIALLDQEDGFTVDAVAPIYESQPMYVLDQPAFLNTALSGQTTLDPESLLKRLKEIEKRVGRQKTFANGPRVVDLDIIYFGTHHHDADTLTIPHPRRLEREFVLRPIVDLQPEFTDPFSGELLSFHLNDLLNGQASELQVHRP